MKKFLATAFHITFFRVLLILSLSGLKYRMTSSGLSERLQLPLIWIGISAFILLITALGISGYIENKGYTVKSWVLARPTSKRRLWTARFIFWGQLVPSALGYSFCFYMFTPTSLSLFIALFTGIVLHNIIGYITKKKAVQAKK